MARIEFVDLGHRYGAEPDSPWALRPMSITWRDGGAYALLGPSGCGKTTLLNIVSGLLQPTQGRVLFDGRDVTALPPEQRNIAQVFQFPVIYDTMSVYDNLAFPLRNRRWSEPAVEKRVHEIGALLELTPDLHRRASGLTADAKQKISLGRGLVRPDVAAILFDEPLTVIDPHLKWLLRRKLKEIHQQLKLSLIYVTHDQVEALTFADTVVVMSQGAVAQSGSAQELFERPAHTFVGHFIGSPGMNFLACEIVGDEVRSGTRVLALDPILVTRIRQAGGRCKLGIRPEFVECLAHPRSDAMRVDVHSLLPMGTHTLVGAKLGEQTVWIKSRTALPASDGLWIRFPPEWTLLYDEERLVA